MMPTAGIRILILACTSTHPPTQEPPCQLHGTGAHSCPDLGGGGLVAPMRATWLRHGLVKTQVRRGAVSAGSAVHAREQLPRSHAPTQPATHPRATHAGCHVQGAR